jgi:hypothetical protein
MAPAATAIIATVGRHPHAWLIEFVSGLPTTSAAAEPTYTAVVARPVWVAGTRRAPIGTMIDHIRPWVTAHSTLLAASHPSPGASADSACATVRDVNVSRRTRRFGHLAVQRTSGTVATMLMKA